MHDYYLLLGVARNASPQVIKIAFEGKLKSLADPAYAASPEQKRDEERLLRDAYVTLTVPAKRGPYDAKLLAAEEAAAAASGDRPRWLWPALAAGTLVAVVAGAFWVEHTKEQERLRIEAQKVELQRETARRKADQDAERLKLQQARQEEALRRSRAHEEQVWMQRDRAEYERHRRMEESRVYQSESQRAQQERRERDERLREEERLRRAQEERRRQALYEVERQKQYLRQLEAEEERARAARHERAQQEAREREYRRLVEERQQRLQQQR